jgi:capsular polysaccharide biosynthesis protein
MALERSAVNGATAATLKQRKKRWSCAERCGMQDQSSVTPAYDLGHYLRPLQRHRALLVICVVAGFLLGAAFTVLKHQSYSSAVSINVNPPPTTPGQASSNNPTSGRTSGQVNLDTEAQILKSTAVAQRAQAILKTSTTVAALRARITATVPPNSTILRIACTARSATAAQACAAAFGTAYLNNRLDSEKASITSQVSLTKQQIADDQTTLNKVSQQIAATPRRSTQRNYLFALQASDQNALNNANNLLNQLDTAVVDPGNVISAAGPGISSAANRAIPPISGLVLGLLIGVGVIFGRENFDRYVRHADDLVRGGAALLAEIQPAQGRETAGKLRRERVARTRFDQRVASVVAGAFDAAGGVVYVAAVSAGQTPDDVAAHLASTLASVGHHVEIVRPAAVEIVESEAVSTARPTPPAIEPADDPFSTSVGWPATSNGEPSSAVVVPTRAAIVQSETMPVADPVPLSIRVRVDAARRRAQFVIIDGDPAVTDAQAYILAGLSDATVLIVDPEATTRDDLDEVVDQISVTGSELLGAVIWRPGRGKRRRDTTDDDATPTRHHRGAAPNNARRTEAATTPVTTSSQPKSWPPHPVDAAR